MTEDTGATGTIDRSKDPETGNGPAEVSELTLEQAQRQRRLWYVIGGVIIVGFLLFGANAFRESITPYVGFERAMSSSSRVQVAGSLVPGSNVFVEDSQELHFELADEEGRTMSVRYRGSTPGNFEEATQIVVMGRYQDGVFKAESLLTKCPSKYQGLNTPS